MSCRTRANLASEYLSAHIPMHELVCLRKRTPSDRGKYCEGDRPIGLRVYGRSI